MKTYDDMTPGFVFSLSAIIFVISFTFLISYLTFYDSTRDYVVIKYEIINPGGFQNKVKAAGYLGAFIYNRIKTKPELARFNKKIHCRRLSSDLEFHFQREFKDYEEALNWTQEAEKEIDKLLSENQSYLKLVNIKPPVHKIELR